MVALVPIVVFGVLLAVVTVPFVALGPGPTFDTLGEIDGKQVVQIVGTQTYPTSGHLNMTTVSQRDGLTLGEALALWLSGQEQLMPRDLVYPPGKSREEIENDNAADFKRSEAAAEYAALGYLKYPKAVTVASVMDPGPSVDKLQAGDAIDAVDGTPVGNLDQFTALLKNTKPGQEVTIDFRRKNEPPGIAQITLGKNKDRDQGVLGIEVVDAPWAPFAVDFHLANVGGPSAGLMFSLASSTSSPVATWLGRRSSQAPARSPSMARWARSVASPTRWPLLERRRDGVSGAREELLRGKFRQPARFEVGEGRDA